MLFISHSSKDAVAADAVRARLLGRGYNSAQIFLDSDVASGISAGLQWEQVLYARLKNCRALIVLCSRDWSESKWCFAELVYAKSAGKEIFPVLIEDFDPGAFIGAHQAVKVYADGDAAYARLWTALESRHLGPRDDFGWPPPDGDTCPFPGLPSFDERYAGVYFGREPETQAVVEELRRMRANGEPRFLMIVGGSGSGKSSLLKAGVLPRLKHKTADTEWLVLGTLRYGETNEQQTIFDQLALNIAEKFPAESRNAFDWKSLRTSLAANDVARASRAFIEAAQSLAVARSSAGATVLLPIDQFEELLWPGTGAVADESERDEIATVAARFLAFLKETFRSANGRLLAIATMRSDYLDVYERHPHALAAPYLHSWRLGVFPRERIRDVILKPAARAYVEIEPDLVDQLERDTPTSEALPLLAFTLEKLYREHAANGKLELREYGGMERAIQNAADAIAPPGKLSPEVSAALRLTFAKHLAAVNDKNEVVRVTARWLDLPPASLPIIERFVEERLLTTAEHHNESQPDARWTTVEVAHEALFRAWPQLREWLRTSADIQRWRRDVERDNPDHRKRVVLRPAQLAVARHWPRHRRNELTEDEIGWIRHAVLRERLQWATVAAVVTLIAVLAVIAQLQKRAIDRERVAAEQAAQTSLGRYLASQSVAVRKNQPGAIIRSLLLAVEGYRRDPSVASASQVHDLLNVVPAPVARFKLGGTATAVAFSPDGKRLAVAAPGLITVWDGEKNVGIASIRVDRSVTLLAWRPDGEQIALGLQSPLIDDGRPEVVLWNWRTRQAPVFGVMPQCLHIHVTRSSDAWLLTVRDSVLTRQPVRGPMTVLPLPKPTGVMAFSQSGERLALKTERGIQVIDTRTGATLGAWTPPRFCTAIAFSADGRLLAIGLNDGSTVVVDWSSGKILSTHHGYLDQMALAFSPDGRLIAEIDSGSSPWFRLWSTRTGTDVVTLSSNDDFDTNQEDDGNEEETTSPPVRVQFANDSRRLLLSPGDSSIRVVSIFDESTTAQEILHFGPESTVSDVALDAEGRRVAVASVDGWVTVWGVESAYGTRHFGETRGARISPAGDVIALFGPAGRIVDAASSAIRFSLGNIRANVSAFSHDGRYFSAGREGEDVDDNDEVEDRRIVLVDVIEGTQRELTMDAGVVALQFSRDSRRLLVADRDRRITAFDVKSVDDEEVVGEGGRRGVFSPDGRYFARTDVERPPMFVYDLTGRTRTQVFPLERYGPTVQFSADGELFASKLEAHRLEPVSAGESPRGKFVIVRQTATGKEVLRARTAPGSVVRFDPRGRYLAVSNDDAILIFDLATTRPLRTLSQIGGTINTIAVAPDGLYVAAFCLDLNLRVWRVDSGELVTAIPQPRGVRSIEFTPDGRTLLVTGSEDGPYREFARLVPWRHEDVIRDACSRATRRALTQTEWQFLAGQKYRETCAGF